MNINKFKDIIKESLDNEYIKNSESQWKKIEIGLKKVEKDRNNRIRIKRYATGIAAVLAFIVFIHPFSFNRNWYYKNGVFVVENGKVNPSGNSGNAMTSGLYLTDLKDLERFYHKDKFDYIIFRGKKISSTSYYTGKQWDLTYDSIETASITISRIEVVEVYESKNNEVKIGDEVEVYENYYFKPDIKGHYVYKDYNSYGYSSTPVIESGEYLFLFRKTPEKKVWHTYFFFKIDYLSLSARDLEDSSILKDKGYGFGTPTTFSLDVYPELFNKYLSHLKAQDYPYISYTYVKPTEKPTQRPGEITPLPKITPMP